MCEESACLVPSLENSQTGPTGHRLNNRGSSGTASNGGDALVGFHEDALSQAAAGKAQLLLTIALGFAVIADASELSLLGYILPAAELQLCLDDHRKEWLVSITHLALGIGAFCWGILGDKVGRKRGLISALSVGALFSTVSTVMPTYGTFMTARFGSGLGIAGIMPLAFSYLAETCPRATRTRYMGLLYSFWPAGALLTSAAAHLTLPSNGAEIVSDNKEHWSSWHKFLLLNILPIVIGAIVISTMSESPRYLLEAAREMEALEVYQKLHKMNKSRTQYGLTELELPGRSAYRERPNNTSRNAIRMTYDTLKETFQRLLSPSYFETTVTLLISHFILSVLYMGISTYSTLIIKDINDSRFTELKKHVNNKNYTGVTFNKSIENVQYTTTYFTNVTFKHMEFSHVEFFDCVFDDTEFSNVKSSITSFENSTLRNCRFFDTDLSERHFINCNMTNTTFISLLSGCMTNFDYNIYLEDLFEETLSWASPMLLALCAIGFILEVVKRPHLLIVLFIMMFLTAIGILFLTNFTIVLVVCGTLKVLMMCAMNVLTVVIVEAFPCNLRCSAHGILSSIFHFTTLFAISLYHYLSQLSVIASGVTTMTFALLGIPLARKLQDNSKVLL